MTSAIDGLFRALSTLRFDQAEKPSRAENLTDILEIVAVAAGVKPAHLNGQGFRSGALLDDLEALARSHDLWTLRTKGIRAYEHRKPGYDMEIYRWQWEKAERERLGGPDILWIYGEPALESVIHTTVSGERDVSETLGYPMCCVRHDRESGLRLRERFVEKLKREHRPQTAGECIRLIEQGAKVRVDSADLAIQSHDDSSRLFPYVQFEVCPACMRSSDSPAAKINRTMRDLAFSLAESFGREIWKAQYEEVQPGLAKTIARNALCPCGSGRTYECCCAASA